MNDMGLIPVDVPEPDRLRKFREELGLSQPELAHALGFSPLKGPQTIRDWEQGFRAGQPFAPTPTAWAAFRYLLTLMAIYRSDHEEEDVKCRMRRLLPESLR